MWAARMRTGRGWTWYGPLNDQTEAEAFAEFLTEEIDPATAEQVAYVTPGLQSPVTALLRWRKRIHAQAANRLVDDLTRETTPAAADTPATADHPKGQQ